MIRGINNLLIHYLSHKLLVLKRFTSLLLFGLFLPSTFANNIDLSPIVDLSDSFQANVYWHKPLANPKNNAQYYIANNDGQLHLIDDNKLVKIPVLDLQHYYDNFSVLNRLTLHPNFALTQQKGYNTFYTAHVEPADEAIRTIRVKDKAIKQSFLYEAVIVEWQLNSANTLKVDPDSKREVLRIGINAPDKAIADMRFNPYIKSWHDNFSHLYIALAYDEGFKTSPLYSGAILRINPEKFGLRSYTTPNNNPFIDQTNIPNELLIVGAQQIMQFIWQKNNDQQLIISHNVNQQPLLSLVNYGDNLLTQAPTKALLTGDASLANASLVVYRGRKFKELRNKLLVMSKQEGRWELQSLKTVSPFQKAVVNTFSNNDLTITDDFSLFTDNHDELMLFSRSQHVIQQLDKKSGSSEVEHYASNQPEVIDNTDNTDDSNFGFIIFFLIALGGATVWFLKNKESQQAVKSLLHKHYARFELSVDNKQVSLFNRHQQTPALIIEVENITRNEVWLNDEHILTIEKDLSGFNAQLEQMLESKFIDEKRVKMVDQRTRKIELKITDVEGIVYGICLYMREGNQRLTKAKFGKVTADIKEWCWFISAQLSPEKTGKRIVKIVHPPKVVAKSAPEKPAETQKSKLTEQEQASKNSQASEDTATQPPTSLPNKPQANEHIKEKKSDGVDSSSIDTQLIEALNKLANLKSKGYLTEDEFISAKAKILANLQKDS